MFRTIQISWLCCQPGPAELWRVKKPLAWERLVQNLHTNCFLIFIPGTLQHAQSKNKLQVGLRYYAGQRAVQVSWLAFPYLRRCGGVWGGRASPSRYTVKLQLKNINCSFKITCKRPSRLRNKPAFPIRWVFLHLARKLRSLHTLREGFRLFSNDWTDAAACQPTLEITSFSLGLSVSILGIRPLDLGAVWVWFCL